MVVNILIFLEKTRTDCNVEIIILYLSSKQFKYTSQNSWFCEVYLIHFTKQFLYNNYERGLTRNPLYLL